jgi:hypothetical protein
MDIVERYLSAYVVECLTGIPGSNPNYYPILSNSGSNTKHPLLQGVLERVHEKEPESEEVKSVVRAYVLNYLTFGNPSIVPKDAPKEK